MSKCRSKIQRTFLRELRKNINSKILSEHKINNYIVDIFIKQYNIIIEFFGDYWHCNPQKYDKQYFHKHKQKTAKQIWKDDKKRINELKKDGYIVEIVWENDFKENISETIKKILDIIEQ